MLLAGLTGTGLFHVLGKRNGIPLRAHPAKRLVFVQVSWVQCIDLQPHILALRVVPKVNLAHRKCYMQGNIISAPCFCGDIFWPSARLLGFADLVLRPQSLQLLTQMDQYTSKDYGGARVLEVSGCPMLFIGHSPSERGRRSRRNKICIRNINTEEEEKEEG